MRVLDEATLTRIIEQVVAELAQDERPPEKPAPTPAARTEPAAPDIRMPETAGEAGCLPDITEIDIREQYLVEQPEHGEAYADLKRNAPCRLGIGKAGARYKTLPQLEFRAAHSAAQDAVFSDVDEAFIASQGIVPCAEPVRQQGYLFNKARPGAQAQQGGSGYHPRAVQGPSHGSDICFRRAFLRGGVGQYSGSAARAAARPAEL